MRKSEEERAEEERHLQKLTARERESGEQGRGKRKKSSDCRRKARNLMTNCLIQYVKRSIEKDGKKDILYLTYAIFVKLPNCLKG